MPTPTLSFLISFLTFTISPVLNSILHVGLLHHSSIYELHAILIAQLLDFYINIGLHTVVTPANVSATVSQILKLPFTSLLS